MSFYITGFIFTLVFIESDDKKLWKELLMAVAWPITLALIAREVYDKIMEGKEP